MAWREFDFDGQTLKAQMAGMGFGKDSTTPNRYAAYFVRNGEWFVGYLTQEFIISPSDTELRSAFQKAVKLMHRSTFGTCLQCKRDVELVYEPGSSDRANVGVWQCLTLVAPAGPLFST